MKELVERDVLVTMATLCEQTIRKAGGNKTTIWNDILKEIDKALSNTTSIDKDTWNALERYIVVSNIELTIIREIIFLAGETGDTSKLREAEWIIWGMQNQRKKNPEPIVTHDLNLEEIKESLKKDPGEIKLCHTHNPSEYRDVNRQAILEIVDIMLDSNCSRGWNRNTIFDGRLKELRNKIVGEE
jgi:hypothetical protein